MIFRIQNSFAVCPLSTYPPPVPPMGYALIRFVMDLTNCMINYMSKHFHRPPGQPKFIFPRW